MPSPDAIPETLWIALPFAMVAGLFLGSLCTLFVHRYVEEKPLLSPFRFPMPLRWLFSPAPAGNPERPHGPAIEVTFVLWAAALSLKFGLSWFWLANMVFGALFIFGSFVDLRTFILPDRVTLGGFVLAIAYKAIVGLHLGNILMPLKPALLGAGFAAGLFWVMQRVYRIVRKEEGLGTGDVKLMLPVGALVGPAGLPFTILAAALGAMVGSFIYMRLPGSSGFKTRIPFGPFLCFGAMLYILVGEAAMRWYVSL
ncbi:prepilin peptidase [Desulfovibrio oxyclinae]|uniref:prepilin peptidase n=1 Tax=Desulfovibrio oxyclinae TaxID=63560 RepID=UPI000373B7A2|nr:A24 family peptidase [Desulfovibrio oxyclinae]